MKYDRYYYSGLLLLFNGMCRRLFSSVSRCVPIRKTKMANSNHSHPLLQIFRINCMSSFIHFHSSCSSCFQEETHASTFWGLISSPFTDIRLCVASIHSTLIALALLIYTRNPKTYKPYQLVNDSNVSFPIDIIYIQTWKATFKIKRQATSKQNSALTLCCESALLM